MPAKVLGQKENMKLIEEAAKSPGAAIGSSRPVAETLKYVPLNRYVGMSGQKFTGRNLYIYRMWNFWCRSTQKASKMQRQLLPSTTTQMRQSFKNADYGIVGDV